MTAEKDFIVRIENPQGFSSGLIYSPAGQSEEAYVFTARHALVGDNGIAWDCNELSVGFLTDNGWSEYKLHDGDVILFGENNASEDIGVLIVKKQFLPVSLNYDKCPEICLVPAKVHELEITGFPKVVLNQLKRTLHHLMPLKDRDYERQIQIEVSDPLTGEYNDDNLVEGYSGSPVFVKVNDRYFCCGLFLAYETKNKRILGIDLSLVNDLLASRSLPLLSLLQIETDPTVLEAAEKLNENSFRVLSRIRDSVGKVNLPRTEISAAALEVIKNGKLAIFTGKPGSGKSAMVKKILDGLKSDFEIFAFQGEQLDKKSIEEIFADKPFCFGISLSEVLDSPQFGKKKIFLIDSIEKILETDNAETILDFFDLLFKREDITLVFTCRSYAAEHLKIRFLRQFPAFPDFDVPALDAAELECIAESYPMLRTLAKNKSLLKVLQIPFNLDKAVSLPQNSVKDDIDTEARFKQIMWEYVIEGREKESDPRKRQLRGETFMEIALKRASAMSAYATVEHARADILHELTADHIIDPEPVYRRSFAAAHDIYEDWALTRHIDSNYLQYIAEEDNYGAFYDAIGTAPAVRRAFRIWISEKIQAMDGSAGQLVKSTLNDSAIQNYWKDEILVAVMQSHYSSDFLRENKDFLFLDQFKYFIRIIFLVRVSCQKPDFSLLNALDVDKRTQVYHNINLVPYGEVWANLIEFIFLNLNLLQPQMRLILSMLLQWEKGLKKNGPFPAEAEHAAKILIWFYSNFTSGVPSGQGRAKTENLENGILMLFRLSDFVKDELKSLIEDAFRNKNRDADFEIGNLYDKILEYALDGYEGQKICKNYPELVLEIAESKWFYYPPTPEQIAEMKRQSILGPYHRSMMHSEQDFGFRRSTERHYSPGSPYETPILNLLLYSPFATVDFLVKLFNHAADSYIKSDFGRDNEFLHPADHRSQITVIMDDGREIKQHASPSLWMMFRGTYFNSPDVLKSCLMAAECYLLQIGRDIKENKHDQYTKFLKASWDYTFEAFLTRCNSVMGSAVLISVANEHMDLAGRRIFPLLKIREIYHLDFHRCLKESEAYSPLSYKKHRQLRHLQLQNFQTLKHRSKSIEDLVMNLSLGEFQTEIFGIIDNFNLENPTDQNWRFALARIDRRKLRIVKEVENGYLLETQLEDDLQKVVEENKTKQEENHTVSYAAYWCMQKFKHETVEEDSYEKWSEFHKISVDAQDNKNISKMHNQPVLVAAMGIRDFYRSLSAAEREWCETKVNELFKYELFENRLMDFTNSKYTVYETEAAFSVVPILMLKSDETQKKMYKQNILYYLTHFHQRSEHNSLRASINSYLWKHDPGFVLNCIFCIVEYSKFSHLKHRLEHLSGYKSYKRNLFSIIKTAHYRIRLKINPHYKPKGRIAGHIKYNDALKQYSAAIDAIMNRVAEEETPVQIAIPEYQSNAGDWLFEALKLVPAETELKILRDYFKNVLNFIFETFAKDSDPYDDTIHHTLQQFFQEKFALFLLSQPEDTAIENFKALIDWAYADGVKIFYSDKRYDFTVKCLEEVVNQFLNDESKAANFWILWSYLSHKILTAKMFIFDKAFLFNHRILSLTQLDWNPLKNKKHFFETFILQGGDLESSGRLTAGIGFEELMPDAVSWLAERIKKEWPGNKDWDFYLEKIIIQTYYDGRMRREITATARLRNDFIALLDKLIDQSASSTAYIIREDFISSKGLP